MTRGKERIEPPEQCDAWRAIRAPYLGQPPAQIAHRRRRVAGHLELLPDRLQGFDVPTAAEQGYDVTWEQFCGIIAPGGITEDERAFGRMPSRK